MRTGDGQRHFAAVELSRRARDLTACDGEGRVHSVFHRCFNVVRPPSDWLTVAVAPFPRVPDGIIVAPPGASGPVDVNLASGAVVSWTEAIVSVPAVGLRIRLTPARVYDTRRRPVAQWGRRNRFVRNLATAWTTLADHGRPEGLGWARSVLRRPDVEAFAAAQGCPEALCRRAVPLILALRAGIRTNDAHRIRPAIEQLVGLGIGLTPSGDDLLSGLAAGLLLGGVPETSNGFAALLQEALREEGRTTEVSAHALRLIVAGEIADVLYDAAFAVAAQDESAVVRTMTGLLSIGGTSGTEIALGLCLGLELAEELSRQPGGI